MKTKDEVINGFLERHTPEGQAIRAELGGIWNNGYHNGYEDADRAAKDKYEVDTNMQYNLGYQHGYDNGKDVANKELSGRAVEEDKAKIEAYKLGHDRGYYKGYATGLEEAQDQNYQNGYDKGADDARYELWWAVSKVILRPERGGLGGIANEEIFETYFLEDIFMNYTPEEVIEKVKSYEESKKSAPTNRDKFEEVFGIRPDEDRQSVVLVSRNGCPHYIDLDKPYKEQEDNDNA